MMNDDGRRHNRNPIIRRPSVHGSNNKPHYYAIIRHLRLSSL